MPAVLLTRIGRPGVPGGPHGHATSQPRTGRVGSESLQPNLYAGDVVLADCRNPGLDQRARGSLVMSDDPCSLEQRLLERVVAPARDSGATIDATPARPRPSIPAPATLWAVDDAAGDAPTSG